MFSKRLKQLREEKGWLQSELAVKIDLSSSAISMYERGERDPDTETLKKLASLFDVTTDYLLGLDNEPTKLDNRANYLYMASSSKIDLATLAKMDDKTREKITKTMNNLIKDFYEEFGDNKENN